MTNDRASKRDSHGRKRVIRRPPCYDSFRVFSDWSAFCVPSVCTLRSSACMPASAELDLPNVQAAALPPGFEWVGGCWRATKAAGPTKWSRRGTYVLRTGSILTRISFGVDLAWLLLTHKAVENGLKIRPPQRPSPARADGPKWAQMRPVFTLICRPNFEGDLVQSFSTTQT